MFIIYLHNRKCDCPDCGQRNLLCANPILAAFDRVDSQPQAQNIRLPIDMDNVKVYPNPMLSCFDSIFAIPFETIDYSMLKAIKVIDEILLIYFTINFSMCSRSFYQFTRNVLFFFFFFTQKRNTKVFYKNVFQTIWITLTMSEKCTLTIFPWLKTVRKSVYKNRCWSRAINQMSIRSIWKEPLKTVCISANEKRLSSNSSIEHFQMWIGAISRTYDKRKV